MILESFFQILFFDISIACVGSKFYSYSLCGVLAFEEGDEEVLDLVEDDLFFVDLFGGLNPKNTLTISYLERYSFHTESQPAQRSRKTNKYDTIILRMRNKNSYRKLFVASSSSAITKI